MAKKKKSEIIIENNEVEIGVATENDKLDSYSDEEISDILDSHIAEDLIDEDPVNVSNLETSTESTDKVTEDSVCIVLDKLVLDNYEDRRSIKIEKSEQLETFNFTAIQPEFSINIESEIEKLITKIQIRQEQKPWYYNQLIEGLLKDILKLEKQRP